MTIKKTIPILLTLALLMICIPYDASLAEFSGIEQGASQENDACSWWLRSTEDGSAAYVNCDGSVNKTVSDCSDASIGVRPVICLSLYEPDEETEEENDADESLRVENYTEENAADFDDSWLIVNASTTAKKKYYKIAEVYPADGYSLESWETTSDSDLSRVFYFTADDPENAVAAEYNVCSGESDCKTEELVETVHDNMSDEGTMSLFGINLVSVQEIQTCEVNGKEAYWFENVWAPEEPEEDMSPYYQNVYFYMPSNMEGKSVILTISKECESTDDLVDTTALFDVLYNAAEKIK